MKMKKFVLIFGVIVMIFSLTASACKGPVGPAGPPGPPGPLGLPFVLTSAVFADKGVIPNIYSPYSGNDYKGSPPLSWTNAPKDTKSFAIAVIDRDVPWPKLKVPAGTFPGDLIAHWMAYGIPKDVTILAEGISPSKSLGEKLPKDAKELYNDCARFGGEYAKYGVGYVGPMPPKGDYAHAYVFTIYSLNVETLPGLMPGTLNKPGSGYGDFTKAMAGKVLATASMTGYFCLPAK